MSNYGIEQSVGRPKLSSIKNKDALDEKYYPDSDNEGNGKLLKLEPHDEFKLPWQEDNEKKPFFVFEKYLTNIKETNVLN